MTRQITLSAIISLVAVFWQLGNLPAEETSAQPAASQQDTAAQQAADRKEIPPSAKAGITTKSKQQKAADAVIEFVEPKFTLPLVQGFSKVIRTKEPIIRVAVASSKVADVVPFKTNEVGVMGKSPGVTTVTFWVGTKEQSEVLQMLVRVEKNVARTNRRQ